MEEQELIVLRGTVPISTLIMLELVRRQNRKQSKHGTIGQVNKMDDLISRQAAIDAVKRLSLGETDAVRLAMRIGHYLERLQSAQQEPLSDAYMKAVWTWLLNYQIKAAELQGRYTPYEVLSWVANDWRKEHERFD